MESVESFFELGDSPFDTHFHSNMVSTHHSNKRQKTEISRYGLRNGCRKSNLIVLPPIVPTLQLVCRCGMHEYQDTVYHDSVDPSDRSAIFKRKSLSELLPENSRHLMESLARISQSDLLSNDEEFSMVLELPLKKMEHPLRDRETIYRGLPKMRRLAVRKKYPRS